MDARQNPGVVGGREIRDSRARRQGISRCSPSRISAISSPRNTTILAGCRTPRTPPRPSRSPGPPSTNRGHGRQQWPLGGILGTYDPPVNRGWLVQRDKNRAEPGRSRAVRSLKPAAVRVTFTYENPRERTRVRSGQSPPIDRHGPRSGNRVPRRRLPRPQGWPLYRDAPAGRPVSVS